MTGRSSIPFDRVAESYDRTRAVDPVALARIVDMLSSELGGRGPILEIGVGTGVIALPVAGAGIPLIGLDLSRPMLEKLRQKAGGVAPFPLLQGDAVRLPFADATFGGAYARWVLHLIPDWRTVLAELTRVVRPGGVVVIEPGGYSGVWRELWLKFMEEGGDAVRAVGLDMSDDMELDRAMAGLGTARRELPAIRAHEGGTLAGFFDDVARRTWSWTWRIGDEDLARVLAAVRAWAAERFGPLDEPIPAVTSSPQWRAYDLPAAGTHC